MRIIGALLFSGLLASLALPASGAGKVVPDEGAGPAADAALVEIHGQLDNELHVWNPDRIPEDLPPLQTWSVMFIKIEGVTYELSLPERKDPAQDVEKLVGKMVVVKGRLYPATPDPRDRGQIRTVSLRLRVEVESIKAEQDGKAPTRVGIQAEGKVEMNTLLGYPGEEANIIQVNGQTYVLDFGGNKDLQAKVQQFDHKRLVVKGTITGTRSFTSMCMPLPAVYPVLKVESFLDPEGR